MTISLKTSIAKLVPGCAKLSLFLARFQCRKYKISENFTKRFGFSLFSSFLVNFGCFLVKNRPKRPKSEKIVCVAFCFVEKHLNTKFQKISSNSLDFANFLHFCQFRPLLVKKAKIGKNQKSGSLVNFHLLKGIYIPNFRKFHQTVWILPIFFFFAVFG